ncbi:unnamed protein product [Cuscuta europaea]|uniref:Uncharacterized protein n=1 Tax=Cuscuta europaea TaxID=41803 RepID=A0A9P0YWR9_CUSEU|nr:unnamed protein product [Cuscuta europaea]
MRRAEDSGSGNLKAGCGDHILRANQVQGSSGRPCLVWHKEFLIQELEKEEEMRIRPPPEPPPWRNFATRVWKTISISVLDCLCFYFELHVVLFVLLFQFVKILEFRTGDEKSDLPVIDSVKPNPGSANLIAFSEVIGPKSGSRPDDRQWAFCLFVTCLRSIILI